MSLPKPSLFGKPEMLSGGAERSITWKPHFKPVFWKGRAGNDMMYFRYKGEGITHGCRKQTCGPQVARNCVGV